MDWLGKTQRTTHTCIVTVAPTQIERQKHAWGSWDTRIHKETVHTKLSRNLPLRLCVSNQWSIGSFDAFLRGSADLVLLAWNLLPNFVKRWSCNHQKFVAFWKAPTAYSGRTSPMVSRVDQIVQAPFDPCCFVLFDKNHQAKGFIGVHVFIRKSIVSNKSSPSERFHHHSRPVPICERYRSHRQRLKKTYGRTHQWTRLKTSLPWFDWQVAIRLSKHQAWPG